MNPVKLSSLFDLKDTTDIQQAIKLIKEMPKVYAKTIAEIEKENKRWIKAQNGIYQSALQAKQSIDQFNASASKDVEQSARLAKESSVLVEAQKQVKKNIDSTTNALNRLTKEQKKVEQSSQKLTATEKELQRLQQKKEALNTKEAQQIAKLRSEINAKNKALRDEAKASLDNISIYDKTSQRVGQLAKQYKNYVVAGKAATKEARQIKIEHDRLRASIIRADQSVGQFQRNVGNYRSALGALGGAARNLFAAFGIVGGVTMFAYLVKDTFELIKETQSLNKALQQVTVTANEYSAQVDFLRQVSDAYGIKLTTLTESYTKFYVATRGTNLQGQETQRIFETVSKAAAVMGLSMEDTEGALKALGQMISKGKVQAEELRGQLGDRLPGAFQIMAEGLGVTTAELDKMLKDGKLLAEDVLPKFATQLEKTYGLETVNKVETLRASQTRLTNAWIQFVTSVEDGEGKIAKVINGTLNKFASILNTLSESDQSIADRFVTKNGVQTLEQYYKILEQTEGKLDETGQRVLALVREQAIGSEAQNIYNQAISQGVDNIDDFKDIQDEFINQYGEEKDNIDILNAVYAEYASRLEYANEQKQKAAESTDKLNKAQRTEIALYQELVDSRRAADEALSADETKKLADATLDWGESLGITKKEAADLGFYIGEIPDKLDETSIKVESTTTKLQALFSNLSEEIALAIETGFELASIAVNSFFDNQAQRRDNELDSFKAEQDEKLAILEENRDRQLDGERLSTEQRKAINQQFEQSKQKIAEETAKREKQIRIQQAKAAKRQAIFSIFLSTASAIIAALAAPPIGLGVPAGIPFSIGAGIVGAAQIAAVASRPLPAYAEGTPAGGHPGGLAVVGDGGGRELIVEPSGKVYFSDDKPQLVDMPTGTHVLNHVISKRVLENEPSEMLKDAYNARQAKSQEYLAAQIIANQRNETDQLINGFKSAINGLPINQFSIGRNGIRKDVKIGNTILRDVQQENEW